MSQKKADISIGMRAYEEAMRISDGPEMLLRKNGIAKNTLYMWRDGSAPGGLHLAKLHYAGADVLYILTGKRSK